ncbi:hypothetical protein BIU88_00480 [Chlorobaculum limnaeum]|uniref:Uncharacterized protein n=1 Tax=Chlorobaculum limnaeum TaxID=274537 RepID=A0A1D8D1X9_CHLLM|nr:hypothetical protein BIU88_00480 [Chlorobaculum limnaeum]
MFWMFRTFGQRVSLVLVCCDFGIWVKLSSSGVIFHIVMHQELLCCHQVTKLLLCVEEYQKKKSK